MTPFLNVEVLPAYGANHATIAWRVKDEFKGGKFIIRKSLDGVSNWQEIGKGYGLSFFVDDAFITNNRVEPWFYQVILQHRGRRYDSSAIGTFGKATRHEFAYARAILKREFTHLRNHTPILICKLQVNAATCPKCSDEITDQQLGKSLCRQCYGTGLEGGYFPGISSFMRVDKNSPIVKTDSVQGDGSEVLVVKEARMLAYPPLTKGDMVIEPAADDRYLVEILNAAALNDKIPLTLNVRLALLPRNNVRYKFPAFVTTS